MANKGKPGFLADIGEWIKKHPLASAIIGVVTGVIVYLAVTGSQNQTKGTTDGQPYSYNNYDFYYQHHDDLTHPSGAALGSNTAPTLSPTAATTDTSTPNSVLFNPANFFGPGTTLTVNANGGYSVSQPSSKRAANVGKGYTVKAGDTLASIAKSLGVSQNQLYNANRGVLSRGSKAHGGSYYDTGKATKTVPAGVKVYAGETLSIKP